MRNLIFCLLTLLGAIDMNAQWSSNANVNTPICSEPGNAANAFHSIEDGQGGMYIAWSDSRSIFSSGTNIYAQHIDSNGYELWAHNGLLICGAALTQSHPLITYDESNGGCIISWTDGRSSVNAVYSQRLTASGVAKWANSGIKVSGSPLLDYSNLSIKPDGVNGGALLFFYNDMGLYSKQVRAQHIDSSGNILWNVDGNVLIDSAKYIDESSFCSDGLGGAYYAWIEKTDFGNLNTKTLFGHVNSIGGILNTGIVSQFSNVNSSYMAPKVVSDLQGNAIVSWTDNRAQIPDKDQIFVQKINAFGTLQWIAGGIAVGMISSLFPRKYSIVGDGNQGVVLAWLEGDIISNKEAKAQRILSSGVKSWSTNGVLLCDTLYAKSDLKITSNQSGGAFISWRQSDINLSFYHLKIVGQQINATGIPQWSTSGITEVYNINCPNPSNLGSTYYLLPDKKHGALISYFAPCFSIGEILIQNICSSGYLGCTPPEIEVRGNQNIIQSGSETSSIINLTDFGTDTLNHSITHLFHVYNLGTSTLNISNIEIAGQQASSFSYTILNTSITLDSTLLAISFSPKTAGLNSATFIITSNDTDEGTYSFVLNGYGINFINQAEYFWDTDPGLGNGISLYPIPNSDSLNTVNEVSSQGIKSGFHYLFIRTQDIGGKWSISEGREIYVKPIIVAMQYFIDNDPGFANAFEIPISPNGDSINLNIPINTNGLSYGEHWVYTRTKNSDGEYSLCEGRKIVIRKAIYAAEYYIDNDPGQGNGISIPIVADTTIIFFGSIQLPILATGIHKLYIRALDQDGLWSQAEIRQFYIAPQNQQVNQIKAAEFYIDDEPGQGSGTNINITQGVSTNFIGNIILPSISTGMHTMYLRVQDQVGKWSQVEPRKFYSNPPNYPATNIVSAEYYFDNDPGYNQAFPVTLSSGTSTQFNASLSMPELSTGIHTVNFRTKDNLGKWSHVEQRKLFVTPFYQATQIVEAEYYIDTDPGQGNASNIVVSNPDQTIQYCGSIILPTLSLGQHRLFIRTKNNRNTWSLQEPRPLSILTNSNLSLFPDSNVLICPTDSVLLTATTNNNFNTYQWYKNCSPIIGATNSTYTANGIGNYFVIVSNGIETQSASVNIADGGCNSLIQIKCFIEGYWMGAGNMNSTLMNQGLIANSNACDSIEISLHNSTPPHNKLYSSKTILQQDGIAISEFPALAESFYLVIQHRNAIETWSASPITISPNTTYDFTTSASQAYGDNQIEVEPGIFAFYAGDINQDENIDLLDASFLEVDINNFEFGYIATDINGDGNVDLLDAPIVENNINGFIYSIHP